MKSIKGTLGLLLLCLSSFSSFSQSDPLRSALNALEQSSLLSGGAIGVWLQDQETGEVLVNYNGTRSFVPASNLKLVTTATALALLGGDYRFTTKGYLLGERDAQGRLNGSLYVLGSGDPSLGSEQLSGQGVTALMDNWIQVLLDKGIRSIRGDLVVDPGVYEANPVPDFWPWADLGNYYGAGIHGLNVSDNMVKLYFKQNKSKGNAVKLLRSEPSMEGLNYDNMVTTGVEGSGDKAYVYGGPFQSQRMILGTLPPGEGEYKIKGSMPDPPAWFGALLKQRLLVKGIQIEGQVKVEPSGKQPEKSQPWFEYASPPMSELVRLTNYYSINLYAEAIFQQIALAKTGKGDRTAAVHEVKKFWASTGIDTLGWILLDGSGLSPLNAISPEKLSGMLRYMANDTKNQDAFLQSLPIAGKNGTVYWFGKNSVIQNNARMKSGSFKGTLCYSGYMTTQTKKKVVFSVMMNRYEGEMRQAATQLLRVLELLAAY